MAAFMNAERMAKKALPDALLGLDNDSEINRL